MNKFYISAAHKSSGKTILSIGLIAAMTLQKLSVQVFKKGPDYIDPMWLSAAANASCYNLDFNTMSEDVILSQYNTLSASVQLSFVEGNKGLYDGIDVLGNDCNAALAKLLKIPVMLVLDTQGITRGIAPLILGYQNFDVDLKIAGVILNKIAGARHEQKIRSVIEHYTDVSVIGVVPKHPDLMITERHLGLIPSNETKDFSDKISKIRSVVEQNVDIHYFTDNVQDKPQRPVKIFGETIVNIGIIKDSAFGFYYPDDLNAFMQLKVKLVEIDALNDKHLPDIDGLYIGGGFPESFLKALEENQDLRHQIKHFVEEDNPVYAECGGLMYLCRSIISQDHQYQMVGALDCDCMMTTKPEGRGYVKLSLNPGFIWQPNHNMTIEINAHEFHYSKIININKNLRFAYTVSRGAGIVNQQDGILYKNTLASFAHLRDVENFHWVKSFVDFVIQSKRRKSNDKSN